MNIDFDTLIIEFQKNGKSLGSVSINSDVKTLINEDLHEDVTLMNIIEPILNELIKNIETKQNEG